MLLNPLSVSFHPSILKKSVTHELRWENVKMVKTRQSMQSIFRFFDDSALASVLTV